MLLQGLPGLLCLEVLPHAAGVGVASVLRLERSGLRTPCQNTSSAYGFTVKGFLLLAPPAAPCPGLASCGLVGALGAPPFVFLSPSFSPPFSA